ncbi:MAG: hypothetical protein K0Q52_166 [Microbacterium sp.]|jgi:hypothetical protein|nr:hypothetical protein [Microbacterium sp.]
MDHMVETVVTSTIIAAFFLLVVSCTIFTRLSYVGSRRTRYARSIQQNDPEEESQ